MIDQSKQPKSDITLDDYLSSIDYQFSPHEELAMEVIDERVLRGMTQRDLAKKMKTKQSVVSRFENLGRSPSLNWLSKVAGAFGFRFRATIHGDFMYIVPRKFRDRLKEEAQVLDKQVYQYISEEITELLEAQYRVVDWLPEMAVVLDDKCLRSFSQGYYLSSGFMDLNQHVSSEEDQTQSLGCA